MDGASGGRNAPERCVGRPARVVVRELGEEQAHDHGHERAEDAVAAALEGRSRQNVEGRRDLRASSGAVQCSSSGCIRVERPSG